MRNTLYEVKIAEKPILSEGFVIRAVDTENCLDEDTIEKFDAVFLTGQHSDAVQLTEAALRRGASAIVLNETACSQRANEMITALCRQYHAMLVTVGTFPSFFDLRDFFRGEISQYEKNRRHLTLELQRILMNLEPLGHCRRVMECYGDFTGSEYSVAVFCIGGEGEGELPDSRTLLQIERCAEIGANEVIEGTRAFRVCGAVALLMEGQNSQAVAAAAASALAAVEPELTQRFPIYAGTGRQGCGVEGLRRAFFTAYRTAKIQVMRNQPNAVLPYETLGVSRMLMELDGNADSVADFFKEMLRPLLDNDARAGTNLTEFLRLYIKLGGCKKKVGEALYMHRNTVNYQLARISEILQRDVSDMQVLAEVMVALKLQELSLGDDVK